VSLWPTRYRIKPRSDRDTEFSPYDSLESLVSNEVIWCRWVRRFPSNEGIKQGYPPPLRNRYFTTIGSSGVKTVANRHRLAAYHSKHCRRALQCYQHRWPNWTLKIGVFSELLAILGCSTHSKTSYRFQRCKVWHPKFKESSAWAPPHERIKFEYPLENVRFLLLSNNLAREWLQIDTNLLRIITSTTDKLSGCTNINGLERHWNPKIGVLVI